MNKNSWQKKALLTTLAGVLLSTISCSKLPIGSPFRGRATATGDLPALSEAETEEKLKEVWSSSIR